MATTKLLNGNTQAWVRLVITVGGILLATGMVYQTVKVNAADIEEHQQLLKSHAVFIEELKISRATMTEKLTRIQEDLQTLLTELRHGYYLGDAGPVGTGPG